MRRRGLQSAPPPETLFAHTTVASALEVRGLTRTFDGGRVRPLHNADLAVGRRQLLAIVGSSGAGKTTLLNILGLLDRPDSGAVIINGTDVNGLGERARSRMRAENLGFIFQDSLVDARRTALENVSLALMFAGVAKAGRRDAAMQALESADIAHRRNVLAGNLSGGERQRVAVARAIAHRPAVLLCDEPTGNLDEENTERVFSLLRSYVDLGCAVVLVTHDLDLARRADAVVRVSQGAVTPW